MADINIGQFSEALNNKMDLDSGNANPSVAKQSDLTTLQNTVATLQATVTNLQGEMSKMLGRIDYSNSVTQEMYRNSYTCPSDGYIAISRVTDISSSNNDVIFINSKIFISLSTTSQIGFYPVSQGDIISIKNDQGGISSARFRLTFCPQKS